MAELVIVPLRHLLVKVLHREPGMALLTKPQHAQDLFPRRPPARWLADPPVDQTLTALHRAAGRASREMSAPRSPASRPLPPGSAHPAHADRERFEPHLPYPLQHRRLAHRPPPFRAVLKPDRSRATRTGQISTQPQSVLELLRACRNRGTLLASASLLRSAVHYGHPGYTAER